MSLPKGFLEWFELTIQPTLRADVHWCQVVPLATVHGPFTSSDPDELASIDRFIRGKLNYLIKVERQAEEKLRKVRELEASKKASERQCDIQASAPDKLDPDWATTVSPLLKKHIVTADELGLAQYGPNSRHLIHKYMLEHGFLRVKPRWGQEFYRTSEKSAPTHKKSVNPLTEEEKRTMTEVYLQSGKDKKVAQALMAQYFPNAKWPLRQFNRIVVGDVRPKQFGKKRTKSLGYAAHGK